MQLTWHYYRVMHEYHSTSLRLLCAVIVTALSVSLSGCISLAVDAAITAVKLPVKAGAAAVDVTTTVGKTVIKTGGAVVDAVNGSDE